MNWINDNSRPLIFIGSSTVMGKLFDICDDHNIEIAGIIDNDYYGNTESLEGIPVIDTEESFNDQEKLKYYKENYNFFCATNWNPLPDEINTRNKAKRIRLINLMDDLELSVISLVAKLGSVSQRATLGRGCFVDTLSVVEPYAVVNDYISLYTLSYIGHHITIGRNCVIQRGSIIGGGGSVVEDDVFFSSKVTLIKFGVTIRQNTFVHEGVFLKRGTQKDEIVTLNSYPRVESIESDPGL